MLEPATAAAKRKMGGYPSAKTITPAIGPEILKDVAMLVFSFTVC
jgi:hypothetical protein